MWSHMPQGLSYTSALRLACLSTLPWAPAPPPLTQMKLKLKAEAPAEVAEALAGVQVSEVSAEAAEVAQALQVVDPACRCGLRR